MLLHLLGGEASSELGLGLGLGPLLLHLLGGEASSGAAVGGEVGCDAGPRL